MRGVCKEGRRKSERGGGRELASFKGRCAVGKKIRASVRERGRAGAGKMCYVEVYHNA